MPAAGTPTGRTVIPPAARASLRRCRAAGSRRSTVRADGCQGVAEAAERLPAGEASRPGSMAARASRSPLAGHPRCRLHPGRAHGCQAGCRLHPGRAPPAARPPEPDSDRVAGCGLGRLGVDRGVGRQELQGWEAGRGAQGREEVCTCAAPLPLLPAAFPHHGSSSPDALPTLRRRQVRPGAAGRRRREAPADDPGGPRVSLPALLSTLQPRLVFAGEAWHDSPLPGPHLPASHPYTYA